jgi:hypothetical protein
MSISPSTRASTKRQTGSPGVRRIRKGVRSRDTSCRSPPDRTRPGRLWFYRTLLRSGSRLKAGLPANSLPVTAWHRQGVFCWTIAGIAPKGSDCRYLPAVGSRTWAENIYCHCLPRLPIASRPLPRRRGGPSALHCSETTSSTRSICSVSIFTLCRCRYLEGLFGNSNEKNLPLWRKIFTLRNCPLPPSAGLSTTVAT